MAKVYCDKMPQGARTPKESFQDKDSPQDLVNLLRVESRLSLIESFGSSLVTGWVKVTNYFRQRTDPK